MSSATASFGPKGGAVAAGTIGITPVILLLAFAVFSGSAVIDLAQSTWQSDAGSLAPIIIALGSVALWRDFQKARRHVKLGSATLWGPALALASALSIFASAIGNASFGAIALWVAGVAVFYAYFGAEVTLRCAFPLLFFAMIVPLPYSLSVLANAELRNFVAEQAVAVSALVGLNVAASPGVIIVGPYELAIENACTGTNSTLSLIAISVLYSYWVRERGWHLAWLICVLAVPIAMMANIGRVVTLVALVQSAGSAVLSTVLHPISGLISFSFAAILLLIADGLIARSWARLRAR